MARGVEAIRSNPKQPEATRSGLKQEARVTASDQGERRGAIEGDREQSLTCGKRSFCWATGIHGSSSVTS